MRSAGLKSRVGGGAATCVGTLCMVALLSAWGEASVKVLPFPSKHRLVVEVRIAQKTRGFSGTVSLDPAVGVRPALLKVTGEGTGEAVLSYDRLPPGSYAVKVSLRDDAGKDLGTEQSPLNVPETPWKGNTIGLSQTPPPPFTPLRVRKQGHKGKVSVECWGRRYALGELGLPCEIRNHDGEMLSSPVSLQFATKEVSRVRWRETRPRMTESSAVKAIVEGSGKSLVGSLKWKCTAEFDGLLRYDFSLEPKKGLSLQQLDLALPLKAEHAKLNWRHAGFGEEATNHRRGALPPGEGVLAESPFWEPYLWLGDEERGLAIFCESTAAWQELKQAKPFLRLERKDGTLRAVWSFANGNPPWQLTKPWKFTFGMLATPVKDTSERRRWRVYSLVPAPAGSHNVWLLLPGREGMPGNMKYFGYPEPKKLADYISNVRSMQKSAPHDSGPASVLQYTLIGLLSSKTSEAFYLNEWRRDTPPNGEFGGDYYLAPDEKMVFLAPTRESTDFFVWKLQRFVKETGLDGLYVDFANMADSTNVNTGFEFDARSGERYWPFFALRELYKRVYTMLKSDSRDAFLMGHMSWNMFIPHLGFCDAYLDGEHFTSSLYARMDYPELLSLDLIQAEFMGHNYGVAACFLPCLDRRPWKDPAMAESYIISMSLLHDYGLMHGSHSMDAIYKAFDEFGIVQARFLPYWSNDDVIRGQTAEIKASAYLKTRGGALVAVANLVREKRAATLQVDWNRLKSPGELRLTDAVTGESLAVQGGSLTLELSPLGFRLLRIQ